MNTRIFLVALSALSLTATGAEGSKIESESRDAASAYIGTNNFIVGRMARDCFEILGRTDTPKEFVGVWQKRNEKYYVASVRYMSARLKEAEQNGGEQEWKKVTASYQSAVQGQGAATVADFFKKGEKPDVCRRVISLIEGKAFDITPRIPIYAEIEALVSFVTAMQ